MARRLVTVFGGNGFVGRHIVQRLAHQGARVRVVCRDTEAAMFLKPLGDVGQIVLMKADITNKAEVAHAVDGADAVINCVGLLAPSGRNTFERVHVEGAQTIAEAAKAAGVKALVQVSALGADAESDSTYARTKAAGEAAVLAAFPEATILRPSVIVGPEDDFLNKFAAMARLSPVLPVMGAPIIPDYKMEKGVDTDWKFPTFGFDHAGGTRFQPVFVGDVAAAALTAIDTAAAQGQTFELVGPTVYTFGELMELVLKYTQRKCYLMPLPLSLAAIMAVFMELVPGKPLTRDQVRLLKNDNVATGDHKTLADLGLTAHTLETVVPSYLATYRPPSGRRGRAIKV